MRIEGGAFTPIYYASDWLYRREFQNQWICVTNIPPVPSIPLGILSSTFNAIIEVEKRDLTGNYRLKATSIQGWNCLNVNWRQKPHCNANSLTLNKRELIVPKSWIIILEMRFNWMIVEMLSNFITYFPSRNFIICETMIHTFFLISLVLLNIFEIFLVKIS